MARQVLLGSAAPAMHLAKPGPIEYDRKRADRMLGAMFDEQRLWVPKYKEIRDFINPWRGIFDGEAASAHNRRDQYLYDGVGFDACTVLAGGIQFGLTPRSRPWFRLGFEDPDLSTWDRAREALNKAERHLYSIFAQSNVYNSFHSLYGDCGPFGTGCMGMWNDYKGVISSKTFTAGTYALGTNAMGIVDKFARKLKLNAVQMMEKFGADVLEEQVKRCARDSDIKSSFNVCHLIMPNPDYQQHSPLSRHKSWVELYWMDNGKSNVVLSVSGYDEFPIMAPRWDVVDDAVYGYGPGWYALVESKRLQRVTEDSLIALEMEIKPAVGGPASTTKNGVNIFPGAVNVYDEGAKIGLEPIVKVKADLNAAREYNADVRQIIKRRFFADLFLMLDSMDKGDMTAREVIERSQEKMTLIGPSIERFQTELLKPVIDRAFNIANRSGVFDGLFPPELQGMELKIEYISPLSIAQKMAGITVLEQGVAFAQNLAATWPNTLKKIDEMKVVDEYFDMLGMPQKVIRPDEEVEAMLEAEAKAKQAAAMAEYSMAATQAAKNLADSQLDGNNALSATLGVPQGVVP